VDGEPSGCDRDETGSLLDWLIFRVERARMMLLIVPNEPRSASIPGSSIPAMLFFSASSVVARAAWRSMVDRRSSFESCAGSILDIWRIVMPTHIVRKARTRVRI
jgi:hypothetical protein